MKSNSIVKKLMTLLLLPVLTPFFQGCIPKGSASVKRPEIKVNPWKELTVKSTESGSDYKYMYLKGPSQDAPVLLLIHGGIFDERIWLYTTDLNKNFNVYALNYPDNSLFYTAHPSDWGKLIKDFTVAAQIKPDYLAAVSNGAYGAIEYLLQTPDNSVKGLALISTVMYAVSDEEVKGRTRIANLALRLSPAKLLGLINSRVSKTDFEKPDGDITQKEIFYVRPYPYYYEIFKTAQNQKDKKLDTQKIKIPVIVIHGSEDSTMPVHAARLTVKEFPNAEFKEFKGYEHDLVFSNGKEIAKTLAEFFTR
ncbi:MAG: alpha/beta hydrolase [Deltaproteobacteria bacterium]|nr:alpha/beta hydrolase [Deltaproteobacteria bacterium]